MKESEDGSGGEAGDGARGGSGGSTSSGGSGASGGSSGMGSPGAPVRDDELQVGCDFIPLIQSSCASIGCHGSPGGAIAPAAGLKLTGEFVKTLKDTPATFADIYCGNEACTERPASCPTGQLLIDSSDWTKSRMWTSATNTNGCGDVMPIAGPLTADERACYQAFVQTIAALP